MTNNLTLLHMDLVTELRQLIDSARRRAAV